MWEHCKKTIAGLLILTTFAPAVYFGTLPPREAEAISITTLGCGFSDILAAGMALVDGVIDAVQTILGIADAIQGINFAAAAVAAWGAIGAAISEALPEFWVTELNPMDHLTYAADAVGSITGTIVEFLESQMRNLMDEADIRNNATTAASTKSLTFKECVLDPLAWLLKNIIIEGIMRDIMSWVSNGFEGAPAFMTDPLSLVSNIADQAVGLFLFESGLDEYLCSPFQIDVIVDFYLDYSTPRFGNSGNGGAFSKMACTLDDVFTAIAGSGVSAQVAVNNGYNQMVRGGSMDFDGGGFNAMFKLLEDKNNPYGTYFSLQSEAAARSRAFQMKENQLLVHADGWFSLRCDLDGDGVNDNVCTPGEYVAKQVTTWSNSPLKQLEVADELAEIVDAVIAGLISALLKDIGSGGEGLLGAGAEGYWTHSAEYNKYRDDANNYDPNAPGTTTQPAPIIDIDIDPDTSNGEPIIDIGVTP